ncbi:MAG: HIT family protein [Thermogemmatispora sp.]|jgi:histidine triad (HIT) family protein|uniref:HIT family protein n=1 Tax=Thermogemmatispora sp. TaxID=1968838 RepID=UPI001A0F4F2F|nr:HIT family protein [Thermogemmatispora sp.]MBE3565399.1 HIT family protein [Thermogemmatispora sp.]
MKPAAACFVCQKVRGKIAIPGGLIYRDELVQATHLFPNQQGSVYLGYLMIEPLRHAPELADLTVEEAQAIGLLMSRLSRVLKEVLKAEHVYAFVLGDHVPHLHLHLVARHPGAPQQYWGVHVTEWPEAPRGGEAEVSTLTARLRAFLAR